MRSYTGMPLFMVVTYPVTISLQSKTCWCSTVRWVDDCGWWHRVIG